MFALSSYFCLCSSLSNTRIHAHHAQTTVTKLRQRVWETSKSLKSALDHVEDIEDEDEPRILREAMDVLQIPVQEALQSKEEFYFSR